MWKCSVDQQAFANALLLLPGVEENLSDEFAFVHQCLTAEDTRGEENHHSCVSTA